MQGESSSGKERAAAAAAAAFEFVFSIYCKCNYFFLGQSSHTSANKQTAMKKARMTLFLCDLALMFVISESTNGNRVTRARPRAAIDVMTDRFALSDSIDSSACSITTSAPRSAECSAPRSRRMPSVRALPPAEPSEGEGVKRGSGAKRTT